MQLRPTMTTLPYLVVLGGSYVGVNTAQQLATAFASRYRVLLIEKNSHFQHLFAFPRFAVTTGVDTHKSFIPFSPGTFANCPPGSGSVIQAKAIALSKSSVKLDRNITLDGQNTDNVPYDFLVVATGTKLSAPSTLPGSEKLDGTKYLQKHAENVIRSSKIAVIGGGAVGVQMATDIKELYPEKLVTLIHSRKTVMNRYHPQLSQIIVERCQELGIEMRFGSRVTIPSGGYPTDGGTFNVELQDGSKVEADFAIICTGQDPQSSLVKTLSPQSVNERGFLNMRKTLQLDDPELSNIFAVGDVADTGANKAARPGGAQAGLVVRNIQHILSKEPLETYDNIDPPAIHLTLGIKKNVVFRNPAPGSSEPTVKDRDDGRLDMGIDDVWTRRGGGADFHL